tara:strand:- start:2040 stop:2411 length:372 start_codon:yes stop_codon:yes gene_type:complete
MIIKFSGNFDTSSTEWDGGTNSWTFDSTTFGFPMAGSPHIYQIANTDSTFSASNWTISAQIAGAPAYTQLGTQGANNKCFSLGAGNYPTGCGRFLIEGLNVDLPSTGTETCHITVYLLEAGDT